ncbi:MULTISPECIES: isochorismate synthase MenF [Phyllobacteriaceae]|uniref:isochorismate synthase n=1 Tax=Phyllobacterium phragmitis TaxID=2670329 RepID=A0ABQ0H5X0_9HYPH|nr:isochorismate synthase MenF [Mesorhizobium sp. RMAD-H1]MBB2972799.1 isochorismate synthase [Mesorhizobium sp. RMAD-H1]
MQTGTLRIDHPHTAELAGSEGNLLFTSGNRELVVTRIRERITAPALGGYDRESIIQTIIAEALERARKAGQDNPIVIGAIPFDLGEPSCLYVPEHHAWRDRVADQATTDSSMPGLVAQRSLPDENGFKRAVEHAIVNFRHSDVRKAVLSVMRELTFAGCVDVERLLASLRAQNREGYQFRVPLPDGGELVGVSPELLMRREGDRIVSNPLAGSARRLPDPEADRANAERLLHSEKDQYEHSLVVQDIRALLEQHCVELDMPQQPSLINTAALWHLSTRIEARLKDPSTTALQLACLLHPTPAVCGFPTERARRLIRFVEPFERGFFTGMVGWCDAKGNGEWVVTIRCGIVKRETVRLFAGAGIVEASQPESEWAEVQTKLGTMLNACGLAA